MIPGQIPASVKLHTLYRPRKYLHSMAVIERHRRACAGGRFPIPGLFQLTEIHDNVAEPARWFNSEDEALVYVRELGYESAVSP